MTAFIDALADYRRRHPDEAATVAEFAELAQAAGADPYRRERLQSHLPLPRGWSAPMAGALLTHHRKARSLAAAGRARRRRPRPGLRGPARGRGESGLRDLVVEGGLFDLDRHWIPERGAEPGTGITTRASWCARPAARSSSSARNRTTWRWCDIEAIANDPASDESPGGWRGSGWRDEFPPMKKVVEKPNLQHPRPQRASPRREREGQSRPAHRAVRVRLFVAGAADVDHHVTHVRVGAQELAVDVDAAAAEHRVDPRQHARHVAVDVQQAVAAVVFGQADLGKFTADSVLPLSL